MKSIKLPCFAALVTAGLCACNLPLFAQDSTNTPPAGAPPAGEHHHMGGRPMTADQIAEQLKLTDDQKAKVTPIIEAQNKKMSDLHADQDLSGEDRMAKMKTIHEDTAAQLKTILTADQFAQWQKMGPGMRGPHGHRNGGSNAPAATSPQN
jgi:Spy/CpxP family protein refolding chaperone